MIGRCLPVSSGMGFMAKSYVGAGGCGVMQESHLLVFGSWLSGVWHGIAHGVQIQKKTSTAADRRTSVHASGHTWDMTCIIVADERGCKFYISVWDHAFFCGGECRVEQDSTYQKELCSAKRNLNK